MNKYKLIVVADHEHITNEFENVVSSLRKAAKRAEELRQEYSEYDPYVYVACYPYNEDINRPIEDYRCWAKDFYGKARWMIMKMGVYGRIGMGML